MPNPNPVLNPNPITNPNNTWLTEADIIWWYRAGPFSHGFTS